MVLYQLMFFLIDLVGSVSDVSCMTRKFLFRYFALVGAVLVLITLFLLPIWIRPNFSIERSHEKGLKLTERIKKKKGMEVLFTFDYGFSTSTNSGVVSSGAILTKGKYGLGCHLDGTDDSFVSFGHFWNVPTDFTISMWVKLKDLPARQDIFCSWFPRHMGFRLDNDNICFDFTTKTNICTASFPFKKYKEFVHLVAVGNGSSKKLSLYENGILKTTVQMDGFLSFNWFLNIGKGYLEKDRDPFSGIIDDIGIWNRALTEKEILEIYKSPVALDLIGSFEFDRQISQSFVNLFAKLFNSHQITPIDFCHTAINRVKAINEIEKLPIVSIYMGANIERQISRAHIRSKTSGIRTDAASKFRDCMIAINGEVEPCKLSLAGDRIFYPFKEREGYTINIEKNNNSSSCGAPQIELLPPETSGWLIKFVQSKVHNKLCATEADTKLVRLRINGMNKGIYIMTDATYKHLLMGYDLNPLRYDGLAQPFSQRLEINNHYSPCSLNNTTKSIIRDYYSDIQWHNFLNSIEKVKTLFLSDNASPVPGLIRKDELERQIFELKSCRVLPRVEDFFLDERYLLGTNRASWLIEYNLDFDRVVLPTNWTISYKSRAPQWISDSGNIIQRPEREPVVVEFDVTIFDSNKNKSTRSLAFRLMPKNGLIYTIMIWTPASFARSHRSISTLEVLAPTDIKTNATQVLSPIFSGFANIRYKGNSSFLGKRKLINIKTIEPHNLFKNNPNTCSLIGINALSDPLRVWNAFAFDLYKDFPKSNRQMKNIAPTIIHTELFINGQYQGVHEFAERVDLNLLNDKSAIVYRHNTAGPSTRFIRQSKPPVRDADFIPLYNSLINMLESKDKHELPKLLDSMLDVDSIIDYQILYSIMGNGNGRPFRFWNHDILAYSGVRGKFFYVPWDFDVAMQRSWGIVECDLDRLLKEVNPSHQAQVVSRWKSLRATVLSEESLMARFDKILDRHKAYLPFDFNRWTYSANQKINYDKLYEKAKYMLHSQLINLDEAFDNYK